MKVWAILGGILVVLLLFSFVRIGGFAEYSADGLLLRLRLGPMHRTILPQKKKRKKKPKGPKGKKAEEPQKEAAPQEGGTLETVKRFLPLIAETAGRFRRKIRIDQLSLDYTAAAKDPALAALSFGYANVALGMIWPLFAHNFNVKEHRIRTAVDFNRQEPVLYLCAALSLTIGQGIVFALRLLVQVLKNGDENGAPNTK